MKTDHPLSVWTEVGEVSATCGVAGESPEWLRDQLVGAVRHSLQERGNWFRGSRRMGSLRTLRGIRVVTGVVLSEATEIGYPIA